MAKFRRWIVGGSAEVDSRRRESQDKANTEGGEGWVSCGSSSLECLRENA